MSEQMKNEVRSYLLSQGAAADADPFGDGDSLLEAGVIDSVGMVDLISFLETTYGVSVDEDDMTPENFDSINAIVAYVEQKRGQSGK